MNDSPYIAPASADGSHPGERSGMMTFVCISAIILGLLGGMAVVGQIVGAFVGEMMINAQVQNDVGLPLAMIQIESESESASDTTEATHAKEEPFDQATFQLEIQKTAMKVAKKWQTTTIIISIFQGLIAFLLLFGGILGLTRKPAGRTMMLIGFAATIVLVVARFYPTYLIQQESMGAVSEQLEAMPMPKNGGAAPPNPAVFMKLAATVSLVFSAVWSLVLIGFSFWFFMYLRGTSAMAYFFPRKTENEFGFQDGVA